MFTFAQFHVFYAFTQFHIVYAKVSKRDGVSGGAVHSLARLWSSFKLR